MKNQPRLVSLMAASLAMASLASAQTNLYLNPVLAGGGTGNNNALSAITSWWADAAGTTTNTVAVSNAANVLNFNNLVTSSSGFTGRTGGGSGGTITISGFSILNPAGPITVTAGTTGTAQTVTLGGAVGVDMSTATQDFTFRSGSTTGPGVLRIGANQSWKIQEGRTFTLGDLAAGTNTSLTAQAVGRTVTLNGNGTTRMGSIIFNGNVGSNSLAMVIDGTGTSSSGGSVAFNGTANGLGSLSITNATATFAAGGTSPGTVAVNSGGILAGAGTLTGATTINANGTLRPNAAPTNNTSRLTFGSTLSFDAAADSVFDIDGANFTGVTLSTAESLTFGGDLAFNFLNGVTLGTYDLFNFTDSAPGSFASVTVNSLGALSANSGVWSGTYGGNTFTFSEATGDLVVTAAIPEPASFGILAGLAGLGFAASRRRRAA